MAMSRRDAQEMSQAADRITEAVRELTMALNRLMEHQEAAAQPPRWPNRDEYRSHEVLWSYLGAGGLDDREANEIALGLEHRGEQPDPLVTEELDPSPEEVRERREARRRGDVG